MTDRLLLICAGSITILTCFGLLWRYVGQPTVAAIRKVGAFMDAWAGEPARDGLPARPGVTDRLTAIEHELKPNGGDSLRDAVNGIAKQLKEHLEQTSETDRTIGNLAEALPIVAQSTPPDAA